MRAWSRLRVVLNREDGESGVSEPLDGPIVQVDVRNHQIRSAFHAVG